MCLFVCLFILFDERRTVRSKGRVTLTIVKSRKMNEETGTNKRTETWTVEAWADSTMPNPDQLEWDRPDTVNDDAS